MRLISMIYRCLLLVIMPVGLLSLAPNGSPQAAGAVRFEGQFYRGEGDVQYLELLDIARRMFAADAQFQNVAMLYTPAWNGFVEGPTWGAWWIQNSYGPTYCALPFYAKPYMTFLQNAQDLWFDQMGDGVRKVRNDWIPPDGCLCDAASPNWFMPKQGDGRVDIHDWGMEFTAAGLVLQAELLLVTRDAKALRHYLPKLRRCADFIESRRDPNNQLFLAGPAGNLLAPSYAGWKKPDGTFGKAYLAGLSITYIAALDRLIELEKLVDNPQGVELATLRRERARRGLAKLTTDEGYFIKSLDPDGTRHGVFGAKKYGYFEAVANHDAICFRVADDAQAEKIYQKIASIPGLRPHHFIITNYPSLDDMYVPDKGWLWKFGTWVNGGHWSTCEARMIMGYYRLGKFDDARRSMQALLKFARQFRMDNPLVDFGGAVYQPREPINLCYDSFGPPAALIRGLFEYLYTAEGLTLLPHIPPTITRLEQHFPIQFGEKQVYLATVGTGAITSVTLNGKPWRSFDAKSVFLPYDKTPDRAVVEIVLGNATPVRFTPRVPNTTLPPIPPVDQWHVAATLDVATLSQRVARLAEFHGCLVDAGLGGSYEAQHARLAVEYLDVYHRRLGLLANGKLKPLPARSQQAADKSYFDTTTRLCEGLEKTLKSYRNSNDLRQQQLDRLWRQGPREEKNHGSQSPTLPQAGG